ncbi:unnamed protein product, partial [Sphacelaria rigidula]
KNVDTVGVWALSLLYHCPALLLVSVLVMKHSANLLSAKVVSSFGISSVKAELSNPCACVDVFVCCSPPDGIRFLPQEEETIAEIHAEIKGPAGTPYDGGSFHIKLVLGNDFPHSPPRGFFLTKIYHPNVASNGDICVNTLKRDWTAEVTLTHVLQVCKYYLNIHDGTVPYHEE